MALDLDRVKSRAAQVWQGFTTGQRTVTALVLVALLVGGLMFGRWAATPTLVPLFTSLGAEDAAGITEALSAQGVRYQLADGGSSVLVPQDRVHQLRVNLAAEGLPAGDTVGYALLDDQGITTSEFRQRIDYQRALEGELSKTISSIDGVEAATVHVVIPQDDLFADDSKHPTASVLVKTRPGRTLESQQVQAVVNLVASSVEGLAPTQVTLADANGNVLSAPGEDGDMITAGDTRSQQTREFERQLAQSVEGMLAQVVGAGGAVVEVRADLDFDRRQTVTERFNRQRIPTAVTTTEEQYSGTGASVGGVLGPEQAPAPVEPPGTDYSKTEQQREFAVGKVTSEIKTAPGAVERLSVAVLLDDAAQADYGTGDIEQLVAAATGLDPERGDTIQVTRIAFDRSASEAAAEELERAAEEARQAQMMNLIRTAVVVFVILLVLALAYFSMRRATKPKATPVDVSRLQPLLEAEQAEEQRLLNQLPEVQGLPDPRPEPELPAEVAERVSIQGEIADLIDRQPDEVAQLLRGWLADRRS
ncbi:MAG TPA: flagellar basal-body MS-ring/collar protein FliF [Egibacteraceae bacterium]|nr:flagellar basal-body MS-ring/collar protein FliF [Egibacteraceae bacterium]